MDTHARVVLNRQPEPLDVAFEVGDDLVARHEAVGSGPSYSAPGILNAQLGVTRVKESQRSLRQTRGRLRAPAPARVLAPLLIQVIARRQSGLPAADDHGIRCVPWLYLLREARSVWP